MPSKKTTNDDGKKKKRATKPSRGSSGSAKLRVVGTASSAVPRILKKSDEQRPPRKAQVLEDVQAQIALKAHGLHEQRGRLHGYDVEDWLEAERQIVGEKSRT